MPAPAVRRLALAAASAVLACSFAAAPAAAAPPEPVPVVRAELGPAPVVGGPQTVEEQDLVPASRILPVPMAPSADGGQGPLVAVGLALLALVGAFVAGLSRRPEPVD